MAVYSDGSYGFEEGLYVSLPIQCKGNFEYEIVKDITLSDFAKERLKITQDELISEKQESMKTVNPKL